MRTIGQLASVCSRLAVGLELIQVQHQAAVDDYLSGRISDHLFKEKIRFGKEWGLAWNSYLAVLKLARDQQIPCIGLDAGHRGDLRSLVRRDRFADGQIADLFANNTGSMMVILFYYAHLTVL